ncbi:MAG: alpha/beta-hydrolase family protein [Mycobacteriales bacterium]
MWTRLARPASPDTGLDVALAVASAKVPETFAPSLAPRSVLDQGLVTGLSTGLQYLLTLGTQEILQAVAAELARGRPWRADAELRGRQRALTVLADLAVVPLGLGLRRALPPRPGEAVLRGALRQVGWRFAVTGTGGSLLTVAQTTLRWADTRLGARGRLAAFPVAVPVGLAVTYAIERRRVGEPADPVAPAAGSPRPVLSLALAGGVVGTMAGGGYAEHALATLLGHRLAAVLPGGPHIWRIAGHGACAGALVAAASGVWGRAMRRIEGGTVTDAPLLSSDEDVRFTGDTMSGGAGSAVPWASLGREGRRHVLAHVRPRTVLDRPAGVPDLSIETVMEEPARATPIQVYVGLDSAGGPRERVDLALAELERTGAFDRSLLMLISPTGTGYVNYVAVSAVEYLTRGDVATVTLQYSKRPSPLSLGMVKDAREQNRLLWLRILDRLRDAHPRPKVVLFGESLGAHTSQDVFLHWGTLGLTTLGIDRALWIGTPYGSGWMRELRDPARLDVDQDLVAVVNDVEQLRRMERERGSKPRYVLVSHDNDGVTKFGLDLLSTAPDWLAADRPPAETVDGASPRGIPAGMRWRPMTTFFQSLVDMKNAQAPGPYRAWAHDYRADLPRFVSAVFELAASPDQMERIEAALRQRETTREGLFSRLVGTVRG